MKGGADTVLEQTRTASVARIWVLERNQWLLRQELLLPLATAPRLQQTPATTSRDDEFWTDEQLVNLVERMNLTPR